MKIDNDSVHLGDQVWHDRYGWGTVVKLNKGTADVKFYEAERLLTFTDGGKQNGIKVLWWQEPILLTPKKGVDYSRLKPMVKMLYDFYHGGV